ncbi:MAG: hypothetical protein PHP69_05510 [Candidatus Omnitrophica bacterium]|nr:hypothetical protein [Candidatus Omnitrophota bacterium]
MEQNSKKKYRWEKIKIIRIKLNPEQAVLSCCNGVDRAGNTGVKQCDVLYCGCVMGTTLEMISS